MNLLRTLEMFQAVSECGSLRAAAERLNVKPSTVSKELTRLEQYLGAKVLNRSTHAVGLTALGEDVLLRAQRLTSASQALRDMCVDRSGHRSGRVRNTAPIVFGQRLRADLLTDFMQQHVNVDVQLDLDNGTTDLTRDGYDLALRYTDQVDERYIARPIFADRLVGCASADYLNRCGHPSTGDDLRHHHLLILAGLREMQSVNSNGQRNRMDPAASCNTNPMSCSSNDVGVLLRWAQAGLGIASLPRFLVLEHIADGKLIHVLPDVNLSQFQMFAIYQQPRSANPLQNGILKHLTACLRNYVRTCSQEIPPTSHQHSIVPALT